MQSVTKLNYSFCALFPYGIISDALHCRALRVSCHGKVLIIHRVLCLVVVACCKVTVYPERDALAIILDVCIARIAKPYKCSAPFHEIF